jgi:predicted ATPase
MEILTYEYRGTGDDAWHFNCLEFKKINLIVGDTGTGKTRLLNTIFSLGTIAANDNAPLKTGFWNLTFLRNGIKYKWHLIIEHQPEEGPIVKQDLLWKTVESGKDEPIVERTDNQFSFCGREMPRLPRNKTSIALLKEEPEIEPINKGFSSIMRRRFSEDELERISSYQSIPRTLMKQFQKKKDMEKLFHAGLQLNARLFFLMRYFTNIYDQIIDRYRNFFPFITETAILDIGIIHEEIASSAQIPVFCIKEKGVNKWVELGQMSSGMQKVMLMLVDLYILPSEGGIYLIDEYENSLGINTIDFLPTVLFEDDIKSQFIITSHHPYIINKIPVRNWFVFHRSGSDVTVKYGDELVGKYGKSKQQAFIKLINDPFFKRGID